MIQHTCVCTSEGEREWKSKTHSETGEQKEEGVGGGAMSEMIRERWRESGYSRGEWRVIPMFGFIYFSSLHMKLLLIAANWRDTFHFFFFERNYSVL